MKISADISGLGYPIVLDWKAEYALPNVGDTIRLQEIVPKATKKKLGEMLACDVWDIKDTEKTVWSVVLNETMEVGGRSFFFDEKTGEQYCSLALECSLTKAKEPETDSSLIIDFDLPDMLRETEKPEKIRFYFWRYFVHIDLPYDMPQYPAVREYVNILPLLSEADKKLLSETEDKNEGSLLSLLEDGDQCRVRARGWTKDEDSGRWMCMLSVDI